MAKSKKKKKQKYQKKNGSLKKKNSKFSIFSAFSIVMLILLILVPVSAYISHQHELKKREIKRAIENERIKRYRTQNKPKPRKKINFMEKIKKQQQQKKMLITAMTKAAGSHRHANRLLKFFKKNAYMSLPMGPVVTQTIFLGSRNTFLANKNRFETVFMPFRYRKYYPSSIIYQPGKRVMRIFLEFKNTMWLGIVALHEVQHAYDIITGKEKNNKKDWYEGEVRAHSLECEMLKQWKQNVYRKLMDTPVRRLNTFVINKKLSELIKKHFPEAYYHGSYPEGHIALAGLLVCKAYHDRNALSMTKFEITKTILDQYRSGRAVVTFAK